MNDARFIVISRHPSVHITDSYVRQTLLLTPLPGTDQLPEGADEAGLRASGIGTPRMPELLMRHLSVINNNYFIRRSLFAGNCAPWLM